MDPKARTAELSEVDCDVEYPRRLWTLPDADPDAAADLARHLKVSPAVGQVLLNRGFCAADLDPARTFLQPKLTDLIDPARLPGCDGAAARLAEAVRAGETVAVYGDYDVDGITATAILWHALATLGHPAGKLLTYVPHRLDEGYGLNSAALDELADAGASVVVTVDCGITAVDEATHAKSRGLDLIVTDHHEWKLDDKGSAALPTDAFALVHPKLDDDSYGNPDLTGAGVALKLAWQTGKRVTGRDRVSGPMRQFLVDAVALAALGTIADVARLVGENRAIARHGLGGLTKTSLGGLRALIDSAGLDSGKIDSIDVGFKLAPRLNACGRMGHARQAVEMLTVADAGRSRDIASFLEKQNKERQAVEKAVAREAADAVRDNGWDADDRGGIVVAGEGWHPGVVGIVASRLVEEFARPCVVLSLGDDGTAKGSGRSIDGFHLARALAGCDDLLNSHGGHAMAAGVALDAGRVEAFRDRFCSLASEEVPPDMRRRRLKADVAVKLYEVTRPLADEFARLGPFGPGNPRPLLVLRGCLVQMARACGKSGDHLQLRLGDAAGTSIKAIAFGCGDLASRLSVGDAVDVAAVPGLNEWQGRVSVELEVRDLAPAGR